MIQTLPLGTNFCRSRQVPVLGLAYNTWTCIYQKLQGHIEVFLFILIISCTQEFIFPRSIFCRSLENPQKLHAKW